MKIIDGKINYFLEEIEQNELMSNKYKKVCITLNYIELFFILPSAVTGCISISAFSSLLGIPIGITSSAIELKICAIAAGIKRYKSIIKKKKKKHGKIVSLAKAKLGRIAVLVSKISHDELVLINNVLKEYDDIKKGIKNLKS